MRRRLSPRSLGSQRAGFALILLIASAATGAPPPGPGEESQGSEDPDRVRVRYEDGIRLETVDGNFSARFQVRAQFRYTSTEERVDGSEVDGFAINRARLKLGGHAYRPWLGYYLEYDMVGNRLLDLRFDFAASSALVARLGQYKVFYNRERIDSSGKQQFVERSIITPPFTVDRQQGATIMGRLFAGTAFDSRYALGVFTGTGRGGALDDDGRPLVVGRWQWNFLRRELGYSQSDVGRKDPAAASLALAGASNRSRFTAFSSSGGGQLPGFPDGESGQYRTDQAMTELALMWRGLSIQGEAHWKRIDDTKEQRVTELTGYYIQSGYFPAGLLAWFPRPLELAIRYASIDPDQRLEELDNGELTIAANWFFHGHRNKLTADLSRLDERWRPRDDVAWRFRFQWDVSL